MSGRRQADYAWTVLARVLSWGLDRGLVAANPCERGGRLYRASRTEKIWTPDDEAIFLKHAPAHLHLPLLLALWTGQRQGDLLRLPWSAYDGTHIRLAAIEDGGESGDPSWRAAEGGARRDAEALAPSYSTTVTASHGPRMASERRGAKPVRGRRARSYVPRL